MIVLMILMMEGQKLMREKRRMKESSAGEGK